MLQKNHYTLDQVLDAVWFLKQEKWVDKILTSVKEKIFWNDLNNANIEEFKGFVRKFTSLYYLMKDKFSEVERTSWERYFEHLRVVVNNVLELPNPNTQKVLIAIAHDSIEDTNKTFEWLAEDYWYGVALAVEAISKESWKKYQNFDITDDNEREREAKRERNEDYFWHLESFETFKEHINKLALEQNIVLSGEELDEITRNALDVKFADRIHNLTTQWDPNDLKQVRKKVDETKRYFLKIAHETCIEAYNKLQSLILILEVKLSGTSERVGVLLNAKQ